MHAKAPRVLLLTAWLLATGSPWDLVQAGAWVRMFVANAGALPVADALERTFAPEGMCEVCHLVQEAKRETRDETAPAGDFGARSPVVFQTIGGLVIGAKSWTGIAPADATCRSVDRAAPALTPPRARC